MRMPEHRAKGRTSDDQYWTQATCYECGLHHMVNTFNAREKCPQCIANPLPKSNRPINAKAHRYWSVVYDKEHDENIRLRKGAKFTEYDIDEMERQGVIAPGSMFRHTKTRKYRVIKERR